MENIAWSAIFSIIDDIFCCCCCCNNICDAVTSRRIRSNVRGPLSKQRSIRSSSETLRLPLLHNFILPAQKSNTFLNRTLASRRDPSPSSNFGVSSPPIKSLVVSLFSFSLLVTFLFFFFFSFSLATSSSSLLLLFAGARPMKNNCDQVNDDQLVERETIASTRATQASPPPPPPPKKTIITMRKQFQSREMNSPVLSSCFSFFRQYSSLSAFIARSRNSPEESRQETIRTDHKTTRLHPRQGERKGEKKRDKKKYFMQ